MIRSQDRSGWFGASDTAFIMGNWETVSFARFWLEKQGVTRNTYRNVAMQTGSAYEHRILDFLEIRKRDRQIRIRRLRLRVNLDGETINTIHEVKTHGKEFRISKAYWQQAQVEMFASSTWRRRLASRLCSRIIPRKALEIVAYRLLEDDYRNYYNPIEEARISRFPVAYDPDWIEQEYLPRLRYLARCLRKRIMPSINEFQKEFAYVSA